MIALGIQIVSTEAILVVIKQREDDSLHQIEQSCKFGIKNHKDSSQVRQFRD